MFSHFALAATFVATYQEMGSRAYSTSRTTKLQQVEDYGDPKQVELEPDAPSAYIWRLSSVTRYEQRDGGVYLEIEGMALSRTIPAGLGWVVSPFVRHAAEETMEAALRQTRDAVEKTRNGSIISQAAAAGVVKGQ
jgi:hypothetical protein